jgi:hypothetical protein
MSTPRAFAREAIRSAASFTSSWRKCCGIPMRPFVASRMSRTFSMSRRAITKASRRLIGTLAMSPPDTTTSRTLGVRLR